MSAPMSGEELQEHLLPFAERSIGWQA